LYAAQVSKRLFDVDIVSADGEAPVWHPDVRFFKVLQVRHWDQAGFGFWGQVPGFELNPRDMGLRHAGWFVGPTGVKGGGVR
jgi:hypothetical protein